MALRFDGRCAIVTGGGGGLGRAYALLLASRGARVVVNDLGGSLDGDGIAKSSVAEAVVAEIRAAGGEAVADANSVLEGERIVETALRAFGRVDIVINNAGIIRDSSFAKMTEEDWKKVLDVHLTGSYSVTRAAWPLMREQNFGRVVMTTSAAGLYGNFGQANYAAAKMALVGFMRTLAREGGRRNIHVNTIAPIAGSRIMATVLPAELIESLKPDFVAPVVAWLCHEDCKENGTLLELGGGWVGRLRYERSGGVFLPQAAGDAAAVAHAKKSKTSLPISALKSLPEDIRDAWEKIVKFDTPTTTCPDSNQDAIGIIMEALDTPEAKKAIQQATQSPKL